MAEQSVHMGSIKNQKIEEKMGESKKKKAIIAQFEPYIYLIPTFLIFGVFVFYPFIKTIIMSMSNTNLRGEIIIL